MAHTASIPHTRPLLQFTSRRLHFDMHTRRKRTSCRRIVHSIHAASTSTCRLACNRSALEICSEPRLLARSSLWPCVVGLDFFLLSVSLVNAVQHKQSLPGQAEIVPFRSSWMRELHVARLIDRVHSYGSQVSTQTLHRTFYHCLFDIFFRISPE